MKKIKALLLIAIIAGALVVPFEVGTVFSDVINHNETGENSGFSISLEDNLESRTGNQVELYLTSSGKDISSINGNGYSSCFVDDTSIAKISNGKIVPVSEGFTFLTLVCDDYIYNHNVIVHSGTEQVNKILVENKEATSVNLNVGSSYQLSVNDGKVDLSNVKVINKTKYQEVFADDIISIDENGKLKVVGVGECDVQIKSSTNRFDKGKTLHVVADIKDKTLKSSVLNYFKANGYEMAIGNFDGKVITKDELTVVDTLTFSSLYSGETQTWKAVLPALKTIKFDVSSSATSLGNYSINNDEYDYEIIGKSSQSYALNLTAKTQSSLNIKFTNFNFKSYKKHAVDFSTVQNVQMVFDGKCSIVGQDGAGANSGYSAIVSKNLNIELLSGSKTTIKGGNGGSASSGGAVKTRSGATAVSVDNLSIEATAFSSETQLSISGGNGGNAYENGTSGGSGGIALNCSQSLTMSGYVKVSCVGGNGGNGKEGVDGADGQDGAKGNNESQGKDSTYGYNGRPGKDGKPGQDGGDGGDGGSAIVLTKMPTIQHSVLLSLKSGNGGNGANGGDGGDGGRGGNGGDDDRWSFLWIGDMSGGEGGKGGKGGSGGSKGGGGASPIPITVNGLKATLDSTNITEIRGKSGNAGVNGDSGLEGDKGSHGAAGAGG